MKYSKDKSTLQELNKLKKTAESKLKKLSPQSTKPWYRRFYFSDENLDDVFEVYNKYRIKNQGIFFRYNK